MEREKNLYVTYLRNIYCSSCNVLGAVLGAENTKMNERVPALRKLRAQW